MKNINLEIKVGIFIVIGFVLFLVFAVASNTIDFRYGKKTISLIYETNDAGSIYKKADVFYKGVKIGFIKEITLHPEHVELELSIYKKYQIPNNISMSILPDSILGTKVVYIISLPEASTGFIESGNRFSDVNNDTKVYDVASLIKIVGALSENTQELLSEVASLARSTTGLIQNINDSVLNENTLEDFYYIIDNLGAISEGLVYTINDVNTYFDADTRSNLHETIQNVNLFTERLLSNDSLLTNLLTNDTLAENLTSTINSISRASAELISTKYNFNFDMYGYYNLRENFGDYSLHGGVDIMNSNYTNIITLGLARIPFQNIGSNNTSNYLFGGSLGINILYGRSFFNKSLILKLGLINSVGGVEGSYRLSNTVDIYTNMYLENFKNISFNYGIKYYFESLFLSTGIFIDPKLKTPSYFFGGGISLGDKGMRRYKTPIIKD